jgi:hypothetical protein
MAPTSNLSSCEKDENLLKWILHCFQVYFLQITLEGLKNSVCSIEH